MRVLAVALAALTLGWAWLGCAWLRGEPVRGDPAYGVEIANSDPIDQFYERAITFYARLTNRRVNTHATYEDAVLRGYFRTEQAYSDYYADLAQALDDAVFEKNRPLSAEITEFLIDAPGRARVRYKMTGANGLPLRPGKTSFHREDRWEREEGQWWIIPGRL